MPREIALNHGKVALVDDDDFLRVTADHVWSAWKGVSGVWYAICRKCKPNHKMHKMIAVAPDGLMLDHHDGNGLNNTRQNLRIATGTQNQANSKLRKDNKSGFKGVTPFGKKWRAQLKVGGRFLFLGSHATPELAALAYDAAARKHYGDFARLNKPRGKTSEAA